MVVETHPSSGLDKEPTPSKQGKPISLQQELLMQQIEEALKESDIVYEQTDGKNFIGA